MKILITGANGFLGKHLVSKLLDDGHYITLILRMNTKIPDFFIHSRINIFYFDLNDINKFNLIKPIHPDVLIHLAWDNLPNYTSNLHLLNYHHHINFFNSIIRFGIKKIIVTGTCLEYGISENLLFENKDVKPTTIYGLTKNMLRQYLQFMQKYYSFHLQWLRIFYVYGPGQHPNSLYSQIQHAIINNDAEFKMSKGDQIRDFIHVNDVSRIVSNAVKNNSVEGIINVCSGKPQKVIDFVKKLLDGNKIKLNNNYYDYPSYEPKNFWGSTEKLKQLI